MIDTTYDPEADAVYFRIGRGQIIEIAEAGPTTLLVASAAIQNRANQSSIL